MSDFGQRWKAHGMAAEQRKLVDKQLTEMYTGNVHPLFEIVGDALGDVLRAETKRPLVLIDVGCSSAYYSEVIEHLHKGQFTYVGVDYSPDMVRLARVIYPCLPILELDIVNGIMPDGQFDVVLSGATICHIEDWRRAVSNLSKLARRWMILHRTMIYLDAIPTSCGTQYAYGQTVPFYFINEDELMGYLRELGFELRGWWSIKEHTDNGVNRTANRTYLLERNMEV